MKKRQIDQEIKNIEQEVKKLYARRNKLLDARFITEERPLCEAEVGNCYEYVGKTEYVKLLAFDDDEGYKIEELTLIKEKKKPIRIVRAVYWKGSYPFYTGNYPSPLGFGYTKTTEAKFNAFAEALREAEDLI